MLQALHCASGATLCFRGYIVLQGRTVNHQVMSLVCLGSSSHLEAPTSEAADKDDLLGGLANVNEAATAGGPGREVGDIHVPILVNLQQPGSSG